MGLVGKTPGVVMKWGMRLTWSHQRRTESRRDIPPSSQRITWGKQAMSAMVGVSGVVAVVLDLLLVLGVVLVVHSQLRCWWCWNQRCWSRMRSRLWARVWQVSRSKG